MMKSHSYIQLKKSCLFLYKPVQLKTHDMTAHDFTKLVGPYWGSCRCYIHYIVYILV